jgi:hypothetical protein
MSAERELVTHSVRVAWSRTDSRDRLRIDPDRELHQRMSTNAPSVCKPATTKRRRWIPISFGVGFLAAIGWFWLVIAGLSDNPGRLTGFHLAIWRGEIDSVRAMLEQGRADANRPIQGSAGGKFDGYSPLMLAIERGRYDLAAVLVEYGADPNLCVDASADRHGLSLSPIYIALAYGEEESLRPFLVDRLDPRTECFREGALQALGSRRGSADAVLAQLLEHARSRMDGMEAQYLLAAAEGGARESCRVLLDMSVAIDTRGPFGLTPLMAAAGSGSVEVVELLLDRGADRALKDNAGKTAFDHVVRAEAKEISVDRTEALRRLLAAGDGGR